MEIVSYSINNLPEERVEWLWDGYLGSGLMTLLASPPKVGKSTLLYHLLKAMSHGSPFLDQDTRRANILVFSEEPLGLIEERRDELDLGAAPIRIVPVQIGLNWQRCINFAKQEANRGAKLLVVDTLRRFWGLHDEADNAEIARTLGPLLALTRHHNLATLLIHHTRKAQGSEGRAVSGGFDIVGGVDIAIEFGRMAPWDKTSRRRLDALSRYRSTPETLIATLDPETNRYHLTEDASGGLERNVINLITIHGGVTAQQLEEELGISLRQLQRVLAELTGRGVLERDGSGVGHSPYIYSLRQGGS